IIFYDTWGKFINFLLLPCIGMKRYFWLVCFALELSNVTSQGCCGGNNTEGICSKCCSSFQLTNGKCEECPQGFYSANCSKACDYPYYGKRCSSSCNNYPNNCSEAYCNSTHGCQNNNLESPTTHKLEGTAGTKDVIKTRMTSMHTEKFTTAVIETDFVSKDALWLVSIVKLLGYTLGISLLIILGLVCLLLCKRRRELKALDISQPIERDFRLLNYFSNRNVDRVASNINSRNNINNSEVLF
ncbi:uncharacterized protein LOC128186901, partial [Crassostrea angulata]|uniref:uncharacterized protein LOC128186901 n=1 Tax=Magallana angulata TaxID=2784310 RepID=UPI0022B1FA43